MNALYHKGQIVVVHRIGNNYQKEFAEYGGSCNEKGLSHQIIHQIIINENLLCVLSTELHPAAVEDYVFEYKGKRAVLFETGTLYTLRVKDEKGEASSTTFLKEGGVTSPIIIAGLFALNFHSCPESVHKGNIDISKGRIDDDR